VWENSMEWFRRTPRVALVLCAVLIVVLLNGAKAKKPSGSSKKEPKRTHEGYVPKGRPWYERMFADGTLRIALFWGWDHPRETIEAVFPAFKRSMERKFISTGEARGSSLAFSLQSPRMRRASSRTLWKTQRSMW